MGQVIAVGGLQTGGGNLIKQTPKEELLIELRRIKMNNLSSAQVQKLSDNKKVFCRSFKELCYSRFGLSPDQLIQFKDEHLKELDNLLFGRAKWARLPPYLIFLIPVFGQVAFFVARNGVLGIGNHGPYYVARKFLKKTLGKDYFPIDELRKYLEMEAKP